MSSETTPLTILPIGKNPRILPAGECIAVQSTDDASALQSLRVIAARRHVVLAEKVYAWGKGYYYAEIIRGAS
jgi:hypothetical protein